MIQVMADNKTSWNDLLKKTVKPKPSTASSVQPASVSGSNEAAQLHEAVSVAESRRPGDLGWRPPPPPPRRPVPPPPPPA